MSCGWYYCYQTVDFLFLKRAVSNAVFSKRVKVSGFFFDKARLELPRKEIKWLAALLKMLQRIQSPGCTISTVCFQFREISHPSCIHNTLYILNWTSVRLCVIIICYCMLLRIVWCFYFYITWSYCFLMERYVMGLLLVTCEHRYLCLWEGVHAEKHGVSKRVYVFQKCVWLWDVTLHIC